MIHAATSAKTQYRLMEPGDLLGVNALLPPGDQGEAWEFPTMVAVRDGEVIGVCSTRTTHGVVELGRLLVTPGRHTPWVTLRLVEAYEATLQALGITAYWWGIEGGRPEVLSLLRRLGFTPAQASGDSYWYRKEVGHVVTEG